MTLSSEQRGRAERLLEDLCERKYPRRIRQNARPEIVWERGALLLYERRPPWRPEYGPEWSRQPIARFRHTTEGWVLYCADRDGRWHADGARGPTPTPESLMRDLASFPA